MFSKQEILADLTALRLLRHRSLIASDYERALIVTPFGGQRGPAGMAIALDGTPPQALVIAIPGPVGGQPIFLNLTNYSVRTVKASEKPAYQRLQAFYAFAIEQGAPLTL